MKFLLNFFANSSAILSTFFEDVILCIMPHFFASYGLNVLPPNISSIANDFLTSLGKTYVPVQPGIKPKVVSGNPKTAFSPHII